MSRYTIGRMRAGAAGCVWMLVACGPSSATQDGAVDDAVTVPADTARTDAAPVVDAARTDAVSTDTAAAIDAGGDSRVNSPDGMIDASVDAARVEASVDGAVPTDVSVDAAPSGDFSVTLNGPYRLRAGTPRRFVVSIARTGTFTGAVALALATPVTHVTVSFTPVTATDATSTMTVSVDAGTPDLSFTLTVNATANGVTHSASAAVNVDTGTIIGRVVDADQGAAAGVRVGVLNVANTDATYTTSTDAFGVFEIPSAFAPSNYDLAIVDARDAFAVVYRGLSRRDPTAVLYGIHLAGEHRREVRGALTGSLAGDYVSTSYDSTVQVSNYDSSSPGTAFDSHPRWVTPLDTIDATLEVLRVHNPTTTGATFDYGTRALQLSSGDVLTGQDVTLAAAGVDHVSGTISGPAGASLYLQTSVHAGRGSALYVGSTSTTTPFDVRVPIIAGATVQLAAGGNFADGSQTAAYFVGIAAGSTSLAFTAPSPPVLSGPADHSTVAPGSPFAFTPFAGGASIVELVPTSAGTHPRIYIVTTTGSARFPDLAALGLPDDTGVDYQWHVVGCGPVASVDAFADSTPVTASCGSVLADEFSLFASDITYGSSAVRTLTLTLPL